MRFAEQHREHHHSGQRTRQRDGAYIELAALHGRRLHRRSQQASGITVDYKEDFNDNEEWFAKAKEPLSRKQDIGADLVVPTTFMATRLHSLGWLNDISGAGWSNKKNLRAQLLAASVDPDRRFSAPYMSSLVGLAYNRAATGRDIRAVDLVREQKDRGQIRRFTGNDYADDLAAGDVAVAQAYSGNVLQLQGDNPDLKLWCPRRA